MGNSACLPEIDETIMDDFDPVLSTFASITESITIKEQHNVLLEKIKKRFKIVDSRTNPNLKWYETLKFNLYLYGNVIRDRPTGQCFFYIKDQTNKNTPILIATTVNKYYVYSDTTLILYQDNIIYYGSIKNSSAYLPRAEGNGIMISRQFIYQGQFKNGYPHGLGNYRSKNVQFVGEFKNGEPSGRCIQKSSKQLFIGTISEARQKVGFKIGINNEKIELKRQLRQESDNRISLRSHLKK